LQCVIICLCSECLCQHVSIYLSALIACVYVCVFVCLCVWLCVCISMSALRTRMLLLSPFSPLSYHFSVFVDAALCILELSHCDPATTHCNTLQHTATHCNTLQHAVPHCTTLQHTATQVLTASAAAAEAARKLGVPTAAAGGSLLYEAPCVMLGLSFIFMFIFFFDSENPTVILLFAVLQWVAVCCNVLLRIV